MWVLLVSTGHSLCSVVLPAPPPPIYVFSEPQATNVDLHLPQGVSRAWLTSEVALCRKSMWQDRALKSLSLVNWSDLPSGRRWMVPARSKVNLWVLSCPPRALLTEADPLARTTGQSLLAQRTSSLQLCSASQTVPVSNPLSHSITLSLIPYVKSITTH